MFIKLTIPPAGKTPERPVVFNIDRIVSFEPRWIQHPEDKGASWEHRRMIEEGSFICTGVGTTEESGTTIVMEPYHRVLQLIQQTGRGVVS